MDKVTELVSAAARPLIVAGHGIRLGGSVDLFREFIEDMRLSFITTWLGADLLPTGHPCNYGIIGMCGQAQANRVLHEADLIVALGTHLPYSQTSTVRPWCPKAKKVVVDIDVEQLRNLTVEVDACVNNTAGDFIRWARELPWKRWRPVPMLWKWAEGSSYEFNERMTRILPEGTPIVIDGGGTALYTGFQSSYVKPGTRLICSASISAMGSGLPEAIGACMASGNRLTTCLIGDGSLMLNVQELQTIAHHKLPIKIFVLNNDGYLAIRNTQDGFLGGRYVGVGKPDLSFPDAGKIAACFGIQCYRYGQTALEAMIDNPYPAIMEVCCPPDQPMLRQAFRDGKPQSLQTMDYL